MRRRIAVGIAASVIAVSVAAALAGGMNSRSSPTVTADINMRRLELMQRIEDGRRAGQLRGIGYMELLGKQQKLLVAQRRVEAEGKISPELHQKFMTDLDRISADIDRELGKTVAKSSK